MKIHELNVGELVEIPVRHAYDSSFAMPLQTKGDAKLLWLKDMDEFVLDIGEHKWPIRGLQANQQALLENILSENKAKLCYIEKCIPENGNTHTAILAIRSFSGRHILPKEEEIVFNLTDGNFDSLVKNFIKKTNQAKQDVLKWLEEHLIVEIDGKSIIVLSAGVSTDFDNLNTTAFRIFGKRIAIDVEKRDDSFWISNIVNLKSSNREKTFILIEGTISFVDASAATQYRKTGITELDNIVKKSAGSYLNLWDQYNQLERKILVDRAKKFGWLHYQECKSLPDGWRLIIAPTYKKKIEQISSQEEMDFELSSDLPEEFSEEADSTSEQGSSHDESDESAIATITIPKSQAGLAVYCDVVDLEQGFVDIKPIFAGESEVPPKKGYIFISLSGDRVRLKRREYAWNRIRRSENPIPGLGLLLERSSMFLSRNFQKEKFDQKKLRNAFGAKPTDNQKLAIEIALNTPDIALIQGPPGTGKTRVISTINKLIADSKNNRGDFTAQILLTSYQHDAVENVANLSQVFGLPALRVGRRKNQSQTIDPAESWGIRIANELKEDQSRSSVTPITAVARKVHAFYKGYLNDPGTTEQTVSMLRAIYTDTFGVIPDEMHQSINSLIKELGYSTIFRRQEQQGETTLLLKAIRGLEIEETGFLDDGPEQAIKLVNRIEKLGVLDPIDLGILKRAGEWMKGEPLDFLPDLARIQEALLEKFTVSRTIEHARLPNTDVKTLLAEIDKCLITMIARMDKSAETVVEQFIFDLENDFLGVKEALSHYSVLLAATCQQAVGRSMQLIKSEGVDFDTVIVDEASRSNPLDLLIPMSLAKRRIILVGDHRQLPHILEQDVERRLEKSSKETRDELGKSLFERLFRFLQEREATDGIKRTVTLNQQFRMHSILGKYVSQTFYEPYGEAFGSDEISDDRFEHKLRGYQGKVAAWIDVPSRYGREVGLQSKQRRKEAEWIANETRKILDQDQDQEKKLSIGVITFYAGQVQRILEEMKKLNLADETDGVLQVEKRWAEYEGKERLRVGTVDAFQGKEFDIVFLSIVRSNTDDPDEDDEILQRRKYGFLTLENRLCVAMSRQKRLLIAVGDEEMVLHRSASVAIRGLVEFHKLCKGPYGIIQRI